MIVGVCAACGRDARLSVEHRARVVVCGCATPIVPARFFAVAMGASMLREAVRIPLEATVPHHADNGERW